MRTLPRQDVEELKVLADALGPLQSCSARMAKLRSVARSFPASSKLNLHLKQQCFACGGPAGVRCTCRGHAIAALPGPVTLPGKTSSCQDVGGQAVAKQNQVKSLPMVSAKKSMKATMKKTMKAAMKASTKAKTPKKRDRRGRDRSGETQLSGAQKLKNRGMRSKDPGYKAFKWGKHPAVAIMKANQTYKPKRRAREKQVRFYQCARMYVIGRGKSAVGESHEK